MKAVEKANKLIGPDMFQNKWAELFHTIKTKKTERISIPSRNEGISILELNEILYVEGEGAYSVFHTKDGRKTMASKNIGHYVSIFPENGFYRSHQSYLINIKQVRRVMPNDGIVELSNGKQVPLSRSRKNGLMERLDI